MSSELTAGGRHRLPIVRCACGNPLAGSGGAGRWLDHSADPSSRISC